MKILYLCPGCKMPFFAEEGVPVAARGGSCMDCSKTDMLKMFGLPADFLDRRLGPGQ